jgi:hypothetical protein
MTNKPFFTVAKGSGILLNSDRTDFNVNNHIHCAKFSSQDAANDWIQKNGKRFTGIVSKKPVKLFVVCNCPVS